MYTSIFPYYYYKASKSWPDEFNWQIVSCLIIISVASVSLGWRYCESITVENNSQLMDTTSSTDEVASLLAL